MNDKKTWLQKYWKNLLLVITVVFAVFYAAVFSSVWADRNYNGDFWPDFFKWSGIVVGVALAVLWVIGWSTQNKKR